MHEWALLPGNVEQPQEEVAQDENDDLEYVDLLYGVELAASQDEVVEGNGRPDGQGREHEQERVHAYEDPVTDQPLQRVGYLLPCSEHAPHTPHTRSPHTHARG